MHPFCPEEMYGYRPGTNTSCLILRRQMWWCWQECGWWGWWWWWWGGGGSRCAVPTIQLLITKKHDDPFRSKTYHSQWTLLIRWPKDLRAVSFKIPFIYFYIYVHIYIYTHIFIHNLHIWSYIHICTYHSWFKNDNQSKIMQISSYLNISFHILPNVVQSMFAVVASMLSVYPCLMPEKC